MVSGKLLYTTAWQQLPRLVPDRSTYFTKVHFSHITAFVQVSFVETTFQYFRKSDMMGVKGKHASCNGISAFGDHPEMGTSGGDAYSEGLGLRCPLRHFVLLSISHIAVFLSPEVVAGTLRCLMGFSPFLDNSSHIHI